MSGTTYRYKIIPPRKNVDHLVIFDSSNVTITCSCQRFEFVGILCSHALKVLSHRNVSRIPNQYILKRWKKDAKVGSLDKNMVSSTHTDDRLCSRIWFQELGNLYTHFAGVAAESEETYKFAKDVYQKSLVEVEACLKRLICEDHDGDNGDCLEDGGNRDMEHCDMSIVRGIKVKGGQGSNGRGRGTGRSNGSSRYKSALEKGHGNKKNKARFRQAIRYLMQQYNQQHYCLFLN